MTARLDLEPASRSDLTPLIKATRGQLEWLRVCWPPTDHRQTGKLEAVGTDYRRGLNDVFPELARAADGLSKALAGRESSARDQRERRSLSTLMKFWSLAATQLARLSESEGDPTVVDMSAIQLVYLAAEEALLDLSPGLALDPDLWPFFVRLGSSESHRAWLAHHIVRLTLQNWRLYPSVLQILKQESRARRISLSELKQEVAQYAAVSLEQVPPPGLADDALKSLIRYAVHQAEKLVRSELGKGPTDTDEAVPTELESTVDFVAAVEARLAAELARLRPADVEVLRLAGSGLTGAEIAARLGITEQAARVQLHRARKNLETAM